MVLLGLRTKARKSLTVHFDFIIRINELKPWPPSRSLRSIRSVLIQWNLGDNLSGSTHGAAPSLPLGADSDGSIEFNESIRLSVMLKRELSVVNGNGYTFQKNCIEFNLYEPRRDRAMKAQLLGTAVLDLSDHAVVRECLSVNVPVNCRRSYGNTVQPLLCLDIQSFPRQRSDSLTRELSMEGNQGESVSELMGEEYAEESETFGSSSSSQIMERRQGLSVVRNGPDRECKKGMKLEQRSYNLEEDSSVSAADVDSHRHVYTKFGFFLSHPQDDDDDGHDEGDGLSPDSDSLAMSERIDDDETREKQESVREEDEYEPLSDSTHNDSPKENSSEDKVLTSSCDDDALSTSSHTSYVDMPKQTSLSSTGSIKRNPFIVADIGTNARDPPSSVRRDVILLVKESESPILESKIQQLEHSVEVLKGELREAAAIEISLYSVVAEHGSSAVKVHAPARRLSRLYFHADKHTSGSKRLTVSNSIVSGLVTVAKACGSDVPRLTFWLSNAVVLRAVMSSHLTVSPTSDVKVDERPSPKIVVALEKVEKWIFSRIIESLWWQIFTPHMQSGAAEVVRKSTDVSNSTDRRHGSYSVELWKGAFGHASERICPLRAQGHECGCVSLLSKLIMEQLIARLDVAMVNAILRESAEDIPTDPLADPISDAYVLPIPMGKASFGSGAQLKNAIGNWRTWLNDHFAISECNSFVHNGHLQEDDDDQIRSSDDDSSKYFHMLGTLSDLMMLPKDMLLSRAIRKEVCPMFGPNLIRRVLNSFVPDEFCPEPIPEVVLEDLNSEDPYDDDNGEDYITVFPCAAPPTIYHIPSADSAARTVRGIVDAKGGRSLLKKSQTSDDELDELESPVNRIISHSSEGAESCDSIVRYQLLREAWNVDE